MQINGINKHTVEDIMKKAGSPLMTAEVQEVDADNDIYNLNLTINLEECYIATHSYKDAIDIMITPTSKAYQNHPELYRDCIHQIYLELDFEDYNNIVLY